jgi:hypothetical protein
MAKLIEMDLGEGRSLLVEVDDDVSIPRSALGDVAYQRGPREADRRVSSERVQGAIRGFVEGAVAALEGLDAGIERVKLEFGVNLAGGAGVPYVAKGRQDAMLSVTVDCNLAQRNRRLSLHGE